MFPMVFYQREVVSARNAVPPKTFPAPSASSAVVNVKKIANGDDVTIVNKSNPKRTFIVANGDNVVVHKPEAPRKLKIAN
jgi:hypothetical protein